MARTLHPDGSTLTFTFDTGKSLALLILTICNPALDSTGLAFEKHGLEFGRLLHNAAMAVVELDCLDMRPSQPYIHGSSAVSPDTGVDAKVW